MNMLKLKIKNRLPVTIGALLAGVAIAGLLSHFIEAPRAEHDFLHDHLSQTVASVRNEWTEASTKIPSQDKLRISQLIARFESPAFVPTDDKSLTGQALKAAAAAACSEESESCIVPVRVNRRLNADHVNTDLRVLNIRENSLRIDFKTAKNAPAAEFIGLSNEVRNLRFYQTQTGWVLNTAENVSQTPVSTQGREHRFSDLFVNKFIGLNYYPATASWKDFWTEFPFPEIQSDIKKAKQLNVNAMRIFLTHDYFDAIASQDEALEKLKTFLDLCKDNDIQVLITLFDLRPDYTLSNWTADIEHVDSILSAISKHEAVLGVDLKNQPDLDFAGWGEGRVEGWLTVMARHIQTQYPHLPVTAGWSKAENAARLHDVFDVVTYHEYQNPKDFNDRLEKVKNAIGNKPVMITELGSTIWHPPFNLSRTEASQAERLSAQLGQAGEANGVFIWTLNDFEHVGREVVGPLPWRQAQQRHFGLYRLDGTPRPASAILSAYGQTQLSAKSASASQPFQTENQ